MGLAATLVVTASFFDQVSDTGSDRFLVQDRYGDAERVQRLVHLVMAGRGVTVALLLMALSLPISWLYREPRLIGGLIILALSPLIMGFSHLDVRRLQRHFDFRSEAFCMIAGESVSFVATVTAAWITRSYTAVLFGLICRALAIVLVSHLRAERRYALGWAGEHASRLAAWSGPLLLNGVLLFIGMQGDRVMIANQVGIKAIGQYSAVLLLIYYPSSLLSRVFLAMFVPQVAAARDDRAAQDKVCDRMAGQMTLLCMCIVMGFAAVAPPVVTVLYGHKYTQAALLVASIGVLQASRLMLNWPVAIAMGIGRSRLVFYSSVLWLLVFPAGWLGLKTIGGLQGVVTGFALGQIVSTAAAVALLSRALGEPTLKGMGRLARYTLVCAATALWSVVFERRLVLPAAVLLPLSVGLIWWIVEREKASILEAANIGLNIVRNAATTLLPPWLKFRLGVESGSVKP